MLRSIKLKVLNPLRYLRFTPFNLQTEQGRRDERYRLAILSIFANLFSRVAAVSLMLLSVNLTLPYLGVERFGIWMTVASFAGILAFLDLGVGNALTNHVAIRSAADSPDLLRQAISGGLGFLALIGIGMGIVLCLIAYYVPWQRIIKVTELSLIPEVRMAAMCFALLFGTHIFGSGVQRVFAGLQMSYKAHLVSAFTSLVACFAMWLASESKQNIVVLLAIVLGAQTASGLILFVMLIVRGDFRFEGLIPRIRYESHHLSKSGSLFFLLQIGTMVGWGADSVIIASTLGVAQVAIFSVVQRLFQFATQPLSILNAPLWAAYADAHARGDKNFVKETLFRSMSITIIFSGIGGVILLIFNSWLINIWTNGLIVASFGFVALYALWSIFDACGNAFSMFLNGSGVVNIQVYAVFVFIALVLPMKIYFVNKFGLIGVPFATLVSYITAVFGVYGLLYRKNLLRILN